MLLNEYFARQQNGLAKTLNALIKTPYGQSIDIQNYSAVTYDSFNMIPFMTGSVLSQHPDDITVGSKTDLERHQTSGTTGKPKMIYHDPDIRASRYPSYIENLINSSKDPMLVHGSATAMSYWIPDTIFTRYYPHVKIQKYSNVDDATTILKNGDLLYITEYVSAYIRLLWNLTLKLKAGLISADQFRKEYVFIELNGDEMSLSELHDCFHMTKDLFGVEPEIVLVYGMTELGGIGIYVFNPADSSLRYRVKHDKYVEVVNNNDKVLPLGEVGQIVITQLGIEKGSILVRYKTGDIGKLECIDREIYIVLMGRNPSEGTISLQQCKVSIPGLMKKISKEFKAPVRGTFQVLNTTGGNFARLSAELFSPVFSSNSTRTSAVNFLQKTIIEDGDLNYDVTKGYIQFDIRTYKEDKLDKVTKTWKILPPEIITSPR
jgi:hypothetical protein